jgi:2-isopropylmalate synthase
MSAEHGLDLPRRLQVEFSKTVQAVTEASGTEIKPAEIWDVFEQTYLSGDGLRLVSAEVTTERATDAHVTQVTAQIVLDGVHHSVMGMGNGPIDAFVNALKQVDIELAVLDYHQHALTSGSGASSVAYVEASSQDVTAWGVGIDSSILDASLQAVASVASRMRSSARERAAGAATGTTV